ncbi:MAG: AAA family ATPase [Lachnospiraceae bacterium]|nr:AAA family ATPase [Lachnospiraceae bacterium]
MGIYLNSTSACTLYQNESIKPYFVDKTQILEEIFPLIEEGSNYICITRPRRFGKTVMANMIASFLVKGEDSHRIFCDLDIARSEKYAKHMNQHNVIYISFNEIPYGCKSYLQYIERIQKGIIKDLKRAYSNLELEISDSVWDILREIHEYGGKEKFVFVLDEWDFIFHQDFVTEQDKKEYILFLSNLLKDKPYVSLAYMTGILPIAKYSSGSELNMFLEYTMASEEKYSNYFGFVESEVDELYIRYLSLNQEPKVTREGLRTWYDGYHTMGGERVYNPRSVVASLLNNNLGNYWTSSGPYDEIFYYIRNNVDAVRDDIARMVSGTPVTAEVREYAATSMNLSTKDEIFSAMVVYGFLSYESGCVSIPNKELMDKFADMLKKEPSLDYVYRLARESERMLKATLAEDTKTMLSILEYAHDTEVPLLSYNNEADLTAVVNLVYLSARNYYRIEREDKAGRGYVDFIFYPEMDRNADCLILELKVDDTPEAAIQQIKDRSYALRFQGKLGEALKYTGRILAVGIAYDKASKKHNCKIEVLKNFR